MTISDEKTNQEERPLFLLDFSGTTSALTVIANRMCKSIHLHLSIRPTNILFNHQSFNPSIIQFTNLSTPSSIPTYPYHQLSFLFLDIRLSVRLSVYGSVDLGSDVLIYNLGNKKQIKLRKSFKNGQKMKVFYQIF